MTWNDGVDSVVTGAIGLGVGIIVAGKLIKDISSINSEDDGLEASLNRRWRL